MNTKMKMEYMYITPEIAEKWLAQNNGKNRSLSNGTVQSYANDMRSGNWESEVGSAISFDSDGILRDGQHRLAAIIQAGVGIWMWVCWNVSSNGIYDNNRRRTESDQVSIIKPDFESFYRSTRWIAIAKVMIRQINSPDKNTRRVSPKEIIDFTEKHKEDFDSFFLNMPTEKVSKISVSTVFLALFMAYASGVSLCNILAFYNVLLSGMSTSEKEFPIIAYRNYLIERCTTRQTSIEGIKRCQYALNKYLEGTGTKRNFVPEKLIWQFPYKEEEVMNR